MPYEREITATRRRLDATGRTSGIKLLALGGSHAYGLATPDSDVDIRGFAAPTARDVLLGDDFGQVQTMDEVDMCIHSLSKACKLMSQCNPNMVELLGLDEDSILVKSAEYDEMRAHPEWFLSRRAAHTFGGYATAQLRRIQNAMARDAETMGKNRRKGSRKLAKHASHLIRLLHMGTEILRGDGVRTRRDEDADLLLDLKRGMWLSEDESGRRTYDDAFWDLLSESEREFKHARDNTTLPDEPKLEELRDFIADCHKRIVCS